MISSVLALLLAAAPAGPSPDSIARARRAYTQCLSAFMRKSLKDKIETTAFDGSVAPACAAQERAFRTVAIAGDIRIGIKRADAEQNAQSEVDDMLSNVKEMFGDYKSTNTAPE